MFLVVIAGLCWLSLSCWRSMRRRTTSWVGPTVAVALTWVACWYWLALPRAANPEAVGRLARRVEASDHPCIETALRGIDAGDRVPAVARRIAYEALVTGKPAIEVDCKP